MYFCSLHTKETSGEFKHFYGYVDLGFLHHYIQVLNILTEKIDIDNTQNWNYYCLKAMKTFL